MRQVMTGVASPAGVAAQPVSNTEWIDRNGLSANSWNPNKQAPPEHRLLKVSLLENGWTQPIVARPDGGQLEIVDGYHRWLLSADPEVYAMTGGLVPVVRLSECDAALARLATIRHNRARGSHYVLSMADLVADLVGLGLTPAEIGGRLEMDDEEVDRLLDRGTMTKRGARPEFGQAWKV
jgi:ParB-like chromosome segregation protein Spo0J